MSEAGSPLVRLLRRLTAPRRPAAGGELDEQLLAQLGAVSQGSGREALGLSLSALMTIVGAERGFIAVRDEARGLRVVVAKAFGSLDLSQPEAQLSRSILDAALADAGVLVVDDATEDARFRAAPSVQSLRLRAVLAVPLQHRGQPFGVLYLDNPATTAAFDAARRTSAEHLAELVAPIVAREVELARLRAAAQTRALELRRSCGFAAILGESPAMLAVMQLISKLAPTRATVLVTGETGTGKELVARALHAESKRAEAPFIAINCAALPRELVESELFGHESGAFTGAQRRRVGRFEAADRGTLFLDEVGDLPLDAQAKLLRVLDDGQVDRVGGAQPISVDVRVVCATHRDLKELVSAGVFREDLMFRLRVVEVALPPLRDRGEDVLAIADDLLVRFAQEHGSPARQLSAAARLALQTYPWPGNVRELRNVVERAAILATDATVDMDLLPPELAGASAGVPMDIKEATRAFKRRFVQQAWTATRGNHQETAELLGVNPKYLYQLRKDLGLLG